MNHRSVRICAMVFIALIALPVTAPFQTVSLADLFGWGTHAGIGADAHAPIASNAIDARVSTVPALDSPVSRAMIVATAMVDPADASAASATPHQTATPSVQQQPSTILRV